IAGLLAGASTQGILTNLGFYASIAIIFAVLALGFNLQWGYTGLFNAGIAGFYLIGAYVAAIAITAPSPPIVVGGIPVYPGHLGGYSLPLAAGIILDVRVRGDRGDHRASGTTATGRLSRDCDAGLRLDSPDLRQQPAVGDGWRHWNHRYPEAYCLYDGRRALPECAHDRRNRVRDSPVVHPPPSIHGGIPVGSGSEGDPRGRGSHDGSRKKHVQLPTPGVRVGWSIDGSSWRPVRGHTGLYFTVLQLRSFRDVLRLGDGHRGWIRQQPRGHFRRVPDLRLRVAVRAVERLHSERPRRGPSRHPFPVDCHRRCGRRPPRFRPLCRSLHLAVGPESNPHHRPRAGVGKSRHRRSVRA